MEVEILSHSHMPSAMKDRMGQVDTIVIYRVDNRTVDTLTLPGNINDKKLIEAEICKQVKAGKALTGYKFEVK